MTIPMQQSDEVFLAFPVPRARVPEATQFRSTWLASSIAAVRDRGDLPRYLEIVPRDLHEVLLGTVAGVWLPIDVALTHYRACDALHMSRAASHEIGMRVARQVHGTTLSLAVRLARQAGVTPWSILGQLQRLWDRVWRGGGVAVYKRGPKEAYVEIIRWPCAEIPYVRQTMPAVAHGIVEMFCRKAFVHDVPELASATSLGLRVQWA